MDAPSALEGRYTLTVVVDREMLVAIDAMRKNGVTRSYVVRELLRIALQRKRT
jgi:metal-responsive CopG/Arc/MetJ family transcriptional regulator